MNLANKVLIALGLGILAGLALNMSGLATQDWINQNIVNGAFYVVGTIFVNSLKMLVVPLVLFSLIPGIIGIGDISLLGRIGTKAVVLYLVTTAIAITTAVVIAVGSGIGNGMNIPTDTAFAGREAPAFYRRPDRHRAY